MAVSSCNSREIPLPWIPISSSCISEECTLINQLHFFIISAIAFILTLILQHINLFIFLPSSKTSTQTKNSSCFLASYSQYTYCQSRKILILYPLMFSIRGCKLFKLTKYQQEKRPFFPFFQSFLASDPLLLSISLMATHNFMKIALPMFTRILDIVSNQPLCYPLRHFTLLIIISWAELSCLEFQSSHLIGNRGQFLALCSKLSYILRPHFLQLKSPGFSDIYCYSRNHSKMTSRYRIRSSLLFLLGSEDKWSSFNPFNVLVLFWHYLFF